MTRVLVLNGPNLNLLGTRRPEIYGTTTLRELEASCRSWGSALGLTVECRQSNHEGALLDALHATHGRCAGVVLNAGAYTHYAYSLHDAVEAIGIPVVEVHISDVYKREAWRHHSVLEPVCVASIIGHGVDGYRQALEVLAKRIEP